MRERATRSTRWWASSLWRTSSRRSSSQRSWTRLTSTVRVINYRRVAVADLRSFPGSVCVLSWQPDQTARFSPRAEAAGLLHLQTVGERDEGEDLPSAPAGDASLPLHRYNHRQVSEGLAMRWRCFLKFFSGFCSIRGGAVQTGSHLREDPAETDQTPQRGPGAEVWREEQESIAALPVPTQQTRGPFRPGAAGIPETEAGLVWERQDKEVED